MIDLTTETLAGVTPLDHTVLSGGHPRAKAPLVLGNEGAGVIEDAGGREADQYPVLCRLRLGQFDLPQPAEQRPGRSTDVKMSDPSNFDFHSTERATRFIRTHGKR